jgi:hypothetical protein
MGLKDIYYSLEDKWFDFLDNLQSKGIPVYSVVDPLENHGIPSMAVAIGVALLILNFLILPLFMGGTVPVIRDEGPYYSFSVQVANTLEQEVPGATVAALKKSSRVASETTGADGIATLNLSQGTYTLEATASGCNKSSQSISVSEETGLVQLVLDCSYINNTPSTLCFSPSAENFGAMKYRAYYANAQVGTSTCAGIDNCTVSTTKGYEYVFVSEDTLWESDRLSATVVDSYLNAGTCIPMKNVTTTDNATMGDVSVLVTNPLGSPVANVTVKLVSPNDTSYVIEEEYTGSEGTSFGRAFFRQPILTEFLISVGAGENTTYKLDNVTHMFLLMTQEFVISVNISSPTTILVLSQGSLGLEPLPDVMVRVFDRFDTVIADRYTAVDGKTAPIGLNFDEKYKASFFKLGYAYKESTITGGRDNTVTMEAVDPTKIGAIDVYVVFKGTSMPVPYAQLTLKSGNTSRATGYTALPTDQDGRSSFENVLPGEYCIEVSRDVSGPTRCTDNPVSVAAGERTTKIIELNPKLWALWVIVMKDGAVTNKEVPVTITDTSGNIWGPSKTSPITGKVRFDIPEMHTITAKAAYQEGAMTYAAMLPLGTIRKNTEATLVLAPITTSVNFTGVDGVPDLGNATLDVEKQYTFFFNLGMPDWLGERWDRVELTIDDQSKGIELSQADISGFEGLATSISADGATLTFTFSGNYEPHDFTATIPVYVKVKPFAGPPKNFTLRYKASWSKNTTAVYDPDPTVTQWYTTPVFVVSSAASCISPDKTFSCTYYLMTDTGRQPPETVTPKPKVGDTVKMVVELKRVVNETYQGPIKIRDKYNGRIGFTKTDVEKINEDGDKVPLDFDVNPGEREVVINLIKEDVPDLSTALERDQMLRMTLEAEVQEGPASVDVLGTGDKQILGFTFGVTGNASAQINVDPLLFDVTSSFKFNVTKTNTGELIPTNLIVGGTISGTGISQSMNLKKLRNKAKPGNRIDDTVCDGNCFEVFPDTISSLVEGGDITITAISTKYDIKPVTVHVDTCVTMNNPALILAKPQAQCVIEFTPKTGVDAGYAGTDFCAGASKAVVYLKIADGCPLTADNFDTISPVPQKDVYIPDLDFASESVSASANQVMYKWNNPLAAEGTKARDITVKLRAKKDFVNKSYEAKLGLTVVQPSTYSPEQGENFISLAIQKYSTPLTCESTFCNLEQALRYIAGKSGNFKDPAYVYIKLVDQDDYLTNVDLSTAYGKVTYELTGYSANLVDDPETFSNKSGGPYYLVTNSSVYRPKPGINVAVLQTGGDTAKWSYLYFIPKGANVSGFDVINDIHGVQVSWPLQQINPGENRFNVGLIVDKSVGDSAAQDRIRGRLENLTATMWGLPKYTFTGTAASANHQIRAEVCNIADPAEKTNDLTTICGRLYDRTQDITKPAIFRMGTTTYFIANSTNKLEELINASVASLNSPAALSVYDTDYFGGYLALPPADFFVDCYAGKLICSSADKSTIDVPWTSDETTLMHQLGARMKGCISPKEVAPVFPDNQARAHLSINICTGASSTGISNCKEDNWAYFKNRWKVATVPPFGIYWEDADAKKAFAFAPDAETMYRLLASLAATPCS